MNYAEEQHNGMLRIDNFFSDGQGTHMSESSTLCIYNK